MTKYNSLSAIKIDLTKSGICSTCGRRFTDVACAHGTDFAARAAYGKNWERDASDLAALVDVVNASAPLDIDTVDAVRWQDTPEIKEANQASDKFNFDAVKETEF
jgi:hypothetical protein